MAEENAKKRLWRYMPLAALLNLLQTRELHLARADKFEDLLEGRFGLDVLTQHLGLPPFPQEMAEIKNLRSDCFLSCWHFSAAESLAMWRLYENSIAIVSDVGEVMKIADNFCSNLEWRGMFGEIVYSEHFKDGRTKVETMGVPFGYSDLKIPISLQLLFCKADAFNFEREWRLVIWKKNALRDFIRLPITDLGRFLKKVVVAPEAPQWVEETIRKAVESNVGVKVVRSDLSIHLKR